MMIKMWMKELLLHLKNLLKINDKTQISNLQDIINSIQETRQCNNTMIKDLFHKIKIMNLEIQIKEMIGIIFKVK
jgi:hypothetical protein